MPIAHPYLADPVDGVLFTHTLNDPDFLIECYRFGVFPWMNFDQHGLFYFPPLRYIIYPPEIKVPKSIRPFFNSNRYTVTADTCFERVIMHCSAAERKGQESTWISNVFIKAYNKLHRLGYAHSIEVWDGEDLVGGLYGVSVGKIFTGESMFSLKPSASRFGLISLAKVLEKMEFTCIDCQIENPYLTTFGGQNLEREDFFQMMKKNVLEEDRIGSWTSLF